MTVSIAALLTCHNRKEKTLGCLRDLYGQDGLEDTRVDTFLVDDGSTDGTREAVRESFPEVHLIEGDGSLYWNGGMRRAMQAALEISPDFFLWLNDDTVLYRNAIARLLETHAVLHRKDRPAAIVVGALRDPVTRETTYSGLVRTSTWHPLRFARVEPSTQPEKCIVFNGNCVLVPAEAATRIGNLHPKLVHTGGDYEYGLRGERAGVDSWIVPGHVGECPRNPIAGTWEDMSLSLTQRYKALFGIKGQPPKPRLILYSRYGGKLWFVFYPLLYLRPLLMSFRKILSR